jgi:very-short-patch-repair endonuclease
LGSATHVTGHRDVSFSGAGRDLSAGVWAAFASQTVNHLVASAAGILYKVAMPNNFLLPFLIAACALVLIAVTATLLVERKPWLSRIKRKPLLTESEKAFFLRLQRALPGFHVFPQVSFAAFLTVDGRLLQQEGWAVRAKFNRKIVDYVVCTRGTLEIVALVELDDRTHSAGANRKRDEMTQAAGYRTIRFPSKQKPTEAEIAALFNQFATPVADIESERRVRTRKLVVN